MSAAGAMKCRLLYQPLRTLASCVVWLAVALRAAAPSAAAAAALGAGATSATIQDWVDRLAGR